MHTPATCSAGLWQGVRMVACLSLLYGFPHVLLQLPRTTRPLVGSIVLFLILATVCGATRAGRPVGRHRPPGRAGQPGGV